MYFNSVFDCRNEVAEKLSPIVPDSTIIGATAAGRHPALLDFDLETQAESKSG